jgi:hypothetical protein
MSAAVSIVLLCWGLGFVLGVVFPPEVLVTQWRSAVGTPVDADAPVMSVENAGAPPPGTKRAPEAPVAAASPEGQPVPPPELRGALAESSSRVPVPAPPALTQDEVVRPDPVAEAEATATEQVQEAAMRKAEEVEEDVKKAEPRAPEKRKASRRARVTRAERRRDKARVAAPSGQPKGVISQIPIVGPVVGLIVPF